MQYELVFSPFVIELDIIRDIIILSTKVSIQTGVLNRLSMIQTIYKFNNGDIFVALSAL